jgi:carboxyl-terminal processing protease
MWDWERASVPYWPIYRRRLIRRRLIVLLAFIALTLPYALFRVAQSHETVGQRVFDEVVTTIGVRYYDRGFHGESWSELSGRYRTAVVNAPTTDARYAALRAMLAQLHDSHTAVFPPGYLTRGQVSSTAPAVNSDAPSGAGLFDRRRFGIETRLLDRFAALDDSQRVQASIDWRTLKPGVGYLRLGAFPDSIAGMFGWAMSDLDRNDALILDLRGNPGGLVDSVDAVAGVFLPEGTLVSTGTRRYHVFGPQRFTATRDVGAVYRGRVIVLVDSKTRSGAESLARALQYYHRATLIGIRTAGQVLGVDVEIALADGGLLRVATLDMYAPDGLRLEGRGVSPDLLVSQPAAQMAAALRLLAH